jgi:hypothetical protein
LRAHGVLSIVDYPGFEGTRSAPDMETYSKALNAAQYPLSVLAVGERAAGLYRKGVYGNTMTTNPRALDVACATLEAAHPGIRANIVRTRPRVRAKLEPAEERVAGPTSPRCRAPACCSPANFRPQFKCYGTGSTEEWLRERGIGVIHGGENSLRFTPHFAMRSDEVGSADRPRARSPAARSTQVTGRGTVPAGGGRPLSPMRWRTRWSIRTSSITTSVVKRRQHRRKRCSSTTARWARSSLQPMPSTGP